MMLTRITWPFHKQTIQILLITLLLLTVGVLQASGSGGNDTEVTLSSGVLTIADINGGLSDDNLSLSYAAGTYTLRDNGGLLIGVSSIAGSTGDGANVVTFPDTDITGIVFDILGGDDLVTISSVQAVFSDGFTITGGTGLDNARIFAAIATTGSGAINVAVSSQIWLFNTASLTTVDGGITLDANSSGAQLAHFDGIDVDGASIQTTGNGDIQIHGKASSNGSSTFGEYGVYIRNGASVSSTAVGSTAGTISIRGNGGDGSSGTGVNIRQAGTIVTSVDGDIEIIGVGQDSGNFGGSGIFISQIDKIESTGTGELAATVTISGTSGASTVGGTGVSITSATSLIATVDGDIHIYGKSNASGTSNTGAAIGNTTGVKSTGTTENAGKITIEGYGGNGAGDNRGLSLSGTDMDISSVSGNIIVKGVAGNGTANANRGMDVQFIEGIISTGTGPLAATITISGTGGTGVDFNEGIYMASGNAKVTSVDGDIRMIGDSPGSESSNYGIQLRSPLLVESTGTGADAASITMIGTSTGIDNSAGISLFQANVLSVDGQVEITGNNTTPSGTFLHNGLQLSIATVQVRNAPMMLNGACAGAGSSGVSIGSGNLISDGNGDITITAEGCGAGTDLSASSNSNIGDGTHVGAATPATGDIVINANSINMDTATSVESDGTLTIQPRTAGTTISLGASFGSEILQLNDTELSKLQDGFSSITIGRNDAGLIKLDTATFNDPLLLITGDQFNDAFSSPDLTNIGNTTIFSGTVSPGTSPGTLSVNGNVELADNTTFNVELTGPTNTGSHDKLMAAGSVTIGSNVVISINASAYTTHQAGGVITLIDNGSGTLGNTFVGLAEGAEISPDGTNKFTLSYVGGDGNDVTLTAATPTAISLSDAGVNLGSSMTAILFVMTTLGSILAIWVAKRRKA